MTKHTCPHCGNKINIIIEGPRQSASPGRGHIFQSSQKLHNAATLSPALPSTIRETPAYLPTQEAHVTVPLLQSAISGLFTGAIVTLSAGAILVASEQFTVWGTLLYSCTAGCITFLLAAAWVWGRRVVQYDALLWKVEEQTGLDLNRDQAIGKPEPQRLDVAMRIDAPSGPRWQFASIPIEPAKLKELALTLRRGDSFSERTARNAGLTQEEFGTLRDIFVDRGWCAWKHPTRKQQGVELTRGGRFIVGQIAGAVVEAQDDGLSERYEEID